MVNAIAGINTAELSLADQIKGMSDQELKNKTYQLMEDGEDISEYKKEIESRKNKQKTTTEAANGEETVEKQISNILDSKKGGALSNDEKEKIKELIRESIKNQTAASQETQQQVEGNQTEIDRLKGLLETSEKNQNDLLTDTPSLKEYYNFERRRLSTMLKKFDKFKKDSNHYPKNVLIYAMGVTNSKIFGTRQKIKRGRVTLAWKRKEDDIVSNLKTMLDKLKPDSGERSKWKEAIKAALYKELDLALKAHVEKITKQNVLPSRN